MGPGGRRFESGHPDQTQQKPMQTIEEIANRIKDCQDCPLHQTRTNPVPGEGPPNAEIVFIAEGPGHHEDEQGRPFVGQAGKKLEELLDSIGMTRDEVFITNMIKCRPPENRDPHPSEIAACKKHLDQQLEAINPPLIVTLGRFSLTKFLPGETISNASGKLRRKDGRNIYPIIHPAAGLRRKSMMDAVIEHFGFLPEILKTARFLGADHSVRPDQEPTPEPEREPDQTQPTLF